MKDLTDRELLDAIDRAMQIMVRRFQAQRDPRNRGERLSFAHPAPNAPRKSCTTLSADRLRQRTR